MDGERARDYPFEQSTASKFASILGPPADTELADTELADTEPDETEPADTRTAESPSADHDRPEPTSPEPQDDPKGASAPPRKKGQRRSRRKVTRTDEQAAQETGRASAVHIPVELEPRIRAFQRRHGGTRALSNGKLLVWAITDCHARGRLDDLVGARNVGGELFGAWTVTATPDHDGPTFPFTVYLPAPFYVTFDELVTRHGANSRSHLAALALTDFLKQHESEGTS